jgi:hypothetical protein
MITLTPAIIRSAHFLHYYHLRNNKLQHTLPNIMPKLYLKITLLLLGHKFCVIPANSLHLISFAGIGKQQQTVQQA